MVRDRIVLGVRDEAVRQKLLEDKRLTLTSAIEICRAHEAAQFQSRAIAGDRNDVSSVDKNEEIDRVKQHGHKHHGHKNHGQKPKSGPR
jgi:hypothetical protein